MLNDVTARRPAVAVTLRDCVCAGVPEFVKLSSKLTFGEDHPVMKENRVAAVQTVSGTGALRTAAEFITAWRGDGVEMHVPNPTWGNHPPVFDKARMNVKRYEYYDAENISLDFSGMCDSLMAIPDGSAVLFQACAMNPTGWLCRLLACLEFLP